MMFQDVTTVIKSNQGLLHTDCQMSLSWEKIWMLMRWYFIYLRLLHVKERSTIVTYLLRETTLCNKLKF